ncbi:Integrin alpha-7 [Acipenser ruthenus]|uniref:Integrin alpha-7 n=1 Tax=Acipenser ruthenus TaxID=7906 RepID=A0A444UYR9_ACIRT|nr:Integrin alpha-7 [Acipenser ruthenus]
MVYPEHAVSDHTGVPWWIILIAILAGILMLALLVCLLWKDYHSRKGRSNQEKSRIQTQGIVGRTTPAVISEQPDLQPIVARARVVIELPLSVTGMAVPHQLFFSGTTKGESAMTSQEDVGSAVEYKFTVTNPGQSLQTLGSAFLNVMWPHELSNGKWLLYPTGMYFKGDRNTHCSTSQPLNPLRLTDYHNLPGQTVTFYIILSTSAITIETTDLTVNLQLLT